jgi:hypothetical protein
MPDSDDSVAKYDESHAAYMGFLSNHNDHHGNEYHYTIPDIELTQKRTCPNGATQEIKKIIPLGFNSTNDPFFLSTFGIPCSVPIPLESLTKNENSSSNGVKFNPPHSNKDHSHQIHEGLGINICDYNENGVNYSYGGGPCCPAPLQPLGHKLFHGRDLNGPAISSDVHHFYNNLGCPYNDDEVLNGWGTSLITNNNYDNVLRGVGSYTDANTRYRSGHFLIVLEKARPGETPNYQQIPKATDGKKYALSINGIQGRHLFLQRGRRYYFTFRSKIGKNKSDDSDDEDEINDNGKNSIIFTSSPIGGNNATLLWGTIKVPSGTTAWLRVPREFPTTFYVQSTLLELAGSVINIDRYGPGHGYHY